jgi:hypothetical protein
MSTDGEVYRVRLKTDKWGKRFKFLFASYLKYFYSNNIVFIFNCKYTNKHFGYSFS